MAEVKWVKLTTDMFDNRKIRYLRRLPEGNNIVLIWVMLLTMAGRCNSGGMIFLTENVPYTPKMLADELDFEENTVLLALDALERLDMILTDQGVFAIAGWEEYQNIDGMEKIREQNRERKRLQRERQRQALIGSGNICEYCGNEGTTVDHLIPKAKGGLDVPDNTVCSCLSCNMKKTSRDLDIFLNEMKATSVDFELDRIISNKKIMRYVYFDDLTSKFVSRDVTGQVTVCHALEEEIEKDKEKEKEFLSFIQSDAETAKLEYMNGTLGEGVVLMSEEQFNDLLDKLSLDELHKYFSIIVECEKNGRHYKKKSHYQAILDMAAKDRKVHKKKEDTYASN
jgi:predicted phage replisome organizer